MAKSIKGTRTEKTCSAHLQENHRQECATRTTQV